MISCHGWAGGTRIFFKELSIEPDLGGPHLCGSGAISLDMDTFPSVLAHAGGLSTAHVVEGSGPGPDASKQLAARDGDLSAFQTMVLASIRKSTLHYLFL